MERIWLKSYPEGVPAEIDASALGSLGDFITTSVEKFRDRTAFISMGKAMSYGELDRKSRAFASYLKNVARPASGARVALMMPNLLQYPIAAFGALRAGYVVVNCNPLYSPRELQHQLADSGAEAIVVLENFASTLEKAIDGTAVKAVIVTGAGDQLGGVKGRAGQFGRAPRAARRSRLSVCPRPCASIARWPWARAARSPPRRQAGRHRFSAIHGRHHRRAQGRDADPSQHGRQPAPDARLARAAIKADSETFVAALPLYHVFALQVNGFVPLMIGATNLLIANPRDIPALVKALRGTPFTVLPGVNTLFNALLNNKDFATLDFSHLHLRDRRRHGGATGGRRALEAVTGKPLIEAYGLTETSPAAIANPLEHRRVQWRDRPADAFDRHRHSRRRRARPCDRRNRANSASRARR